VLCGLLLPMPHASAETGVETTAAAPIAPEPVPAIGDAELKAMLDAPGNIIIGGERTHSDLLRRFYAAHDYTTVWDARRAQTEALLTAVSDAANHGLDPGSFHAPLLTNRAAALSPIEHDLLLSDAFLGYADALARGAVPVEARIGSEALQPEPVDIVAALDAALAASDPAKAIEALAPQTAEYATLQRAYAYYRSKLMGGTAPPSAGRQRSDPGAAARLQQLAVAPRAAALAAAGAAARSPLGQHRGRAAAALSRWPADVLDARRRRRGQQADPGISNQHC